MDTNEEHLDIHGSLKRLYRSKEYSDAKIICGSETFLIHKAIVCTRSPYFRAAFNSHFAESVSAEIDIQEESPDVLAACLDYIYLDTYTALTTTDPLFHAKIYAAADKYTLPGLMALARVHFNDSILTIPETFDTTIPDIVTLVYSVATPLADGLRQDMVKYIHQRIRTLISEKRFTELFQTVDGFAADLLQAQLTPKEPERKYCNSRGCKDLQPLHYIEACNNCGMSINLRDKNYSPYY